MPKAVKKKKKFIRKKDATTYQLIPGYTEDDTGTTSANDAPKDPTARKEIQKEYGIFYDDDYNYMKHLRVVDEEASLVNVESFRVDKDDETRSEFSRATSRPPLPFKEFFSTDETEGEKIDPDILAALDEAPVVKVAECDVEESGDDFLDDDFIVAAGGVAPQKDNKTSELDVEEEYSDDREFDFDDEDSDVEYSGSGEDFGSDTEDRLESHPGRGNAQDDIAEAQTALILRNFEEGLGFRCSAQAEEEEEMPTAEDYENLKRILNNDKFSQKPVSLVEVLDDKTDRPQIDPQKYLYEDVDEIVWKDAPSSKPKFDCVSILSLNSNTRNLPTDLIPPRKEGKKLPSVSENEAPSQPGLTLHQLEAEMRESRKADRASTFRPKDETAEEKRIRKKAIKDGRKERRQEKKANQEVFSIEKQKMMKETAALAKAVKGVVIS